MHISPNIVRVSVPVHHIRVSRPGGGPGEHVIFSSTLARDQISSLDSIAKLISEINDRGIVHATWHSELKSRSVDTHIPSNGSLFAHKTTPYAPTTTTTSSASTTRAGHYRRHHNFPSSSLDINNRHEPAPKPSERSYIPTITLEGPETDVYSERAYLMQNYWIPTSSQIPVPTEAASNLSEWCTMLDSVAAFCDVSIFVCTSAATSPNKSKDNGPQTMHHSPPGCTSVYASACGSNARVSARASANGTVSASASVGVKSSSFRDHARASASSTSPSLFSPSSSDKNMVIHIQGHTDNVIYANTQVKIVLDHICGLFVDALAVSASMLPALAGENSANFNELEARTGVSLYMFDWASGWMGGGSGSANPKTPFGHSNSPNRTTASTASTSLDSGNIGSNCTSTMRNTATALGISTRPGAGDAFLRDGYNASHHQDSIYISGPQPNVAMARAILSEIISKTDLYSHTIHLSCAKIDILRLDYRDQLRASMLKHGAFIELPSTGTRGTAITVVGSSVATVAGCISDIKDFAQSMYEAELVIDSIHTSGITPSNSVAQWAGQSSCIVSLEGYDFDTANGEECRVTVRVLGSRANVKHCVFDLIGENVSLSSIAFRIELCSSHKDFVAGRKNGKLARVMKLSGAVVDFVPVAPSSSASSSTWSLLDSLALNTHQISTVYVRLVSTECARANHGLRLLEQELPVQTSFFVPEAFHKQIIGSGGARVQAVMRKHNVFVKFGVDVAFANAPTTRHNSMAASGSISPSSASCNASSIGSPIDTPSSSGHSNDTSPSPPSGTSPPQSEFSAHMSSISAKSTATTTSSTSGDGSATTSNYYSSANSRLTTMRNAIYCSRPNNVVIRCPARNSKSLERAKTDILDMAKQCDQTQDVALVYISRAQRRILLDQRAGIIEKIEQKTRSVILFDSGDFDRNGQLVPVKAQPATAATEAARVLASQLPREYVFRIAYSVRFDTCIDERLGEFFSRIVVPFRIALRIEVQVRSADDGGHSIYLSYASEDAHGLDQAVQALTLFLRERQLNIIYKGEHVADSQVR